MSNSPARDLGWLAAAGTPRAIGAALGVAGRDSVHLHLTKSDIWHKVTSGEHTARVSRLIEATKQRFPAVWEEIQGLAQGLDLPVDHVMAWNCRGDLLASAPDGCTTVQIPGATPTFAHNEDGLPFFHGTCFIADITPDESPGFISFCYPGSLPGHSFAVTDRGIAQAVNNLRLLDVEAGIPRMVLGRAVLAAHDLDESVSLLAGNPNSGGFHFTLAQAGRPELLSVEFGGGNCVVKEVSGPSLHTNHALRLPAAATGRQIITKSSHDRQARGDALVAAGEHSPLEILRDTAGPGLPIHRDAPDDPDRENTLATAVMRVRKNGVEWEIYDRSAQAPLYVSK